MFRTDFKKRSDRILSVFSDTLGQLAKLNIEILHKRLELEDKISDLQLEAEQLEELELSNAKVKNNIKEFLNK